MDRKTVAADGAMEIEHSMLIKHCGNAHTNECITLYVTETVLNQLFSTRSYFVHERETETERQRDRERESVCVCVLYLACLALGQLGHINQKRNCLGLGGDATDIGRCGGSGCESHCTTHGSDGRFTGAFR
jgi:hypothetical protein